MLQVWVKTVGKDDDKVVTDDKKRGIRQYFWAENSKVLLYLQDTDGDENFHVYGVDLAVGQRPRLHASRRGPRAGLGHRPGISPTRSWSRSTPATVSCMTSTA